MNPTTLLASSLVILMLASVSYSMLEIKPPVDEYYHNATTSSSNHSPNDDVCSTPIGAGESFAHDVKENVTSGYLNIGTGTASSLFFLFYKCRNLTTTDFSTVPLIIWLQGGPGSTSFLGAFTEFGPYRVVLNDTTQKFEEVSQVHAWNDYYNLLVIDNPVGVGFGNLVDVNDMTQNETRVAEHMLNALLNFYTNDKLSQFASLKNTPLYIFGESYAGHYIPAISDRILKYNAQTAGFKIPLQAAGIGNGWVDPSNQLSEFGLFGYALGLLDDNERAIVEQAQLDGVFAIKKGREFIKQGDYVSAAPYMARAQNSFGTVTDTIVTGGGGVNVYNYRIFGRYSRKNLLEYFNYPETQKSYCTRGSRFGNTTWDTSNRAVYSNMSYYDFMDTVADNVTSVLASIPVLFYNGQDDIICNSPSTQTWISKLNWPNRDAFYSAGTQAWILNNKTHAGFYKNFGTLTYVTVNKAGHLAPMDQIESTIEMLRRFIGGSKNWTGPFNPTQSETKLFDEDSFLIKADAN